MRLWYLLCLSAALEPRRVQQFAGTVEDPLGPPFKVVERAPETFKVYRVGDAAYLVVGIAHRW